MTIKTVMKRVFLSIVILLFAAGLAVSPILVRGFKMYQNAVGNMPIEDKIEQIRSKEDFVAYDEIDEDFFKYLVLEEDHRFYDHKGFSIVSIGRAFVSNLKAGARVEGGSSITQQLAKNLYFTFEKTYERKIAELIVALQLENQLTKHEILELYSNVVYFGEGCYGIEAASVHYFGKSAKDLTDDEIILLVETLKSPNTRNPNARQALYVTIRIPKTSCETRPLGFLYDGFTAAVLFAV